MAGIIQQRERAMTTEQILSQHLTPLETISGPWRLWELKNWNRHRAVLQRRTNFSGDAATLQKAVREEVASAFKISWWRGFAFGVLVESNGPPPDPAALITEIDPRNEPKGTWQWTVVVCPESKKVVGVHTWMEGWLSPLYHALLCHYEDQGFSLAWAVRPKDRLMKILTSVGRPRRVIVLAGREKPGKQINE